MDDIYSLIKDEGWETTKNEAGQEFIIAYDETFSLTHPINIHRKFYREIKNPERKFFHMKKFHDYLWPDEQKTWNYWSERTFRAHCEGKNYITLAGGAASSKSYNCAKVALLFYLANPEKRTVIVASTTLSSLDSRIWGYVKKFLKKCKVRFPVIYTSYPNPKILFNPKHSLKEDDFKDNIKDTIHGMFAIAAKKGDEDEAISGWIGRHPDDSLLLVLDEATDMPLSILKAMPNLEAQPDKFQLIAIGNSSSRYDLHGTLSTPKEGWNSINPLIHNRWDTTQRNGICLFFSCYESPAVHEPDPEKRALLSTFLIDQETIILKELEHGKESDAFYRFVLGFWKTGSGTETVIPSDYIERYHVLQLAEWSGVYRLDLVAGLDAAFNTQGDNCILQIGILGVDVRGKMVLDFRNEKFHFKIPIVATTSKSVELQIVDNVLNILKDTGCPLENLCIDGNGSGRGLAELLRIQANALKLPLRVVTTRHKGTNEELKQDNILVKTAYDMWFQFRGFIEHEQIRGLNTTATIQFTHRLLVPDPKTGRVKLEIKPHFKRRMGNIMRSMARSPDEADACSLALVSAVHNFGFYPGQELKLENPFMIEKMYWQQKAIMEAQAKPLSNSLSEVSMLPQMNFSSSIEDLVSSPKKLF